MKITDIEYRTISIPFVPAIQEHWDMDYPTTLVWVHTDEGLTGLGESNSSIVILQTKRRLLPKDMSVKTFGILI